MELFDRLLFRRKDRVFARLSDAELNDFLGRDLDCFTLDNVCHPTELVLRVRVRIRGRVGVRVRVKVRELNPSRGRTSSLDPG